MSTSRSRLNAVPVVPARPKLSARQQDDADRLALLDEIERLITKAQQLNLKDSAFLLNVAHLDLKTKIYCVSDEELRALAEAARSQLDH